MVLRRHSCCRPCAPGWALASLFSELAKANLSQHRAAPDDVADATDAHVTTEVDGRRLDDD